MDHAFTGRDSREIVFNLTETYKFNYFRYCKAVGLVIILLILNHVLAAHELKKYNNLYFSINKYNSKYSSPHLRLFQQNAQSFPIKNGNYEITFIFKNKLTDAQKSASVFAEGREIVQSLGGNILHPDVPSFYVISHVSVNDGSLDISSSVSLEDVKLAMFIKHYEGNIEPIKNSLPVVSISTEKTEFKEGESINITADFHDNDGVVSQLEFFASGLKLAQLSPENEAGTAEFVWNDPSIGEQTIYAKATDNNGESSFSNHINVYSSTSIDSSPSPSPLPGGGEIEIIAAGAVGDEVMSLRIGGVEVSRWKGIGGDARGGVYERYSYTHDTEIMDISSIQVSYQGGGSNRSDLRVDKIVVDGVSYETEAADTYSTGTWVSGSSIEPGYMQSEWLHAPGYFHYKYVNKYDLNSATLRTLTDEKVAYSEFSIFPNPVVDKFTIQVPEYLEVNHVKVVDLNGTIVYAADHISYNGKVEINISDYNLAEGRYGLLVYLKNGTVLKEDMLKQEPF